MRLRKDTGADPSILERTVYAFGLLEAIRKVNMPFIFKGGTALLVMLEHPRRLSTDIDIIVEHGTDVDGFIKKAGKIFPFIRVEENKRKACNKIEKRHFRFYFTSPRTGKEINVLLDVTFEENPYETVMEYSIKNILLLNEGDDLKVRLPDKNCILADKLTAFAPHTTGIPFGKNKELEIIKQMFDCWTLLQEMDNFTTVIDVYKKVCNIELGYRELNKRPEDCLLDTIESCICIMGRGSVRPDEYAYLYSGIIAIQGHIFSGKINGEVAVAYASEIMYLSANLLAQKSEYERIIDSDRYRNHQLKIRGIKKISSIRNTDPLAYAYMIKSFLILNELGLYKESILWQ